MKKLKTVLILVTIFFFDLTYSNPSAAQVCQGDFILSSQAEVDAFICDEVTGSLTISGNDITNLNALSTLKQIGRHLMVMGNSSLTNVDGLSALIQVGVESSSPLASITILNNPVLKNLDGFSSLTIMHGAIIISDNPQLESVNGFLRVSRISFELRISNNDQVKSINGFKGLRFISSFLITSLVIDDNASLPNIDGLSSLESVGGKSAGVQITNNGSLLNIDGLSSLASISQAGGLTVSNNPLLKNLNGLSSLTRIGVESFGFMAIENNASLEDIDGLTSLRSGPVFSPFSRIIVIKNPVLSKCDGLFPLLVSMGGETVAEHIKTGNINVSENGAGCTIEDIIASGPQSIPSFSLINEETGEVIQQFKESITLDVANPDFKHLAIQANPFPKQVGSIGFSFDEKIKHTENVFPYIFEVPHHLKLGTHSIKADVYSEAHRKGKKGIGLTATVMVINSAAVTSYDIVDTSGKVLRRLNEGDILNLDDLKAKGQTIVANTTGQIGSVKFDLNSKFFNMQNAFPYTLTGDNYGSYFMPWVPQPTFYTLTATPYSKSDAGGRAGQPLTMHFTVKPESSTAVVSYDIVDTSGKILRRLSEGDVLHLDDLKAKGQTIVANTTGQIGSVKFDLNNKFFNMQNAFPYTLTGDNYESYFMPWVPQPTFYTLTATPYSKLNAGGAAGKPLTIHFTVVKNKATAYRMIMTDEAADSLQGDGEADLTIFPVPVDNELFVKMNGAVGNDAVLSIRTVEGLSVYEGAYSKSSSISTVNLKPGVYILHVVDNDGFRRVAKFIKN